MREFVLASASPRRKELLSQIGIKFRTCTSKKDEEILRNQPENIVKDLSYTKARDVYERGNRDAVVIGADTIVVYDNQVIGKPRDEDDAVSILQKLVGNTHRVITGVAIICPAMKKIETFSVTSYVTFKKLSDDDIHRYIENIYVLDKAGAYAMQENHDLIVEKFEGSFDNIVGLPVKEVLECVKRFQKQEN